MENESDGDTNCNWCARKGPQIFHKGTEELEIGRRAKTIYNTAFLGSTRFLRRVLETWCHSNCNEKPPANAGLKNSEIIIIIIIINHLIYMDDIKLIDRNEKELESLIQAMRMYSQDIGMEFGIEKCTMLIIISGKRQMTEEIELPNHEKMRKLEEEVTYKCLGSGQHQTSGDERKNLKRISQDVRTIRNQTI